jgi:spore germination protein KB
MSDKKIVFGSWEATLMLVTMISTKCIMYFPRTMAEDSGTAAWIEVLYISLLALAFFYLVSKLYSTFKGKDIIDICGDFAGNAGKVAIGIITILFLIFIVSTVLRQFGEQMKIISLNNSPISFVMSFFIAGMIAASYFGLEAILRFQSITVTIVMVSYVLYILMLSPMFDFTQLTPLFGTGIENIFYKGTFRISEFSELFFLFLLAPFIGTRKNFIKVGYFAIGLNAFFLLSVTLANLLVMSYPNALDYSIPVYRLGTLIEYGRFFTRIEAAFVTTWALVGLMYLSTGFYFILHVFRKTFNIEYTRPLIPAFIILVFALSMMPPNIISATDLEVVYFRNWSWIVSFALPILILIIARIRLRKKEDIEKCRE